MLVYFGADVITSIEIMEVMILITFPKGSYTLESVIIGRY